MKIGIMQPYFMPYIGYFQLMAAVDKYVIFDDVNYINRGWSARNYIIVNGKKHRFSIAVKGGSQNHLYSQVMILDDFVKFRKTLEMNYKRAPFYVETMRLLDEICLYEDKRFCPFMKHSFEVVLKYLGINTELLFSSDFPNNQDLRGEARILDICKCLGASEYYNAIGGQELYDRQVFSNHSILLCFVKTIYEAYPQLSKEFIPALSIIDILMMNSKEDVLRLLSSYTIE
jgi:hypothetical protein